MSYFIKKTAYILLYIPLGLIVAIESPHAIDFVDKNRINKLPLAMAVLIILVALALIAGLLYLLLIFL